MDLKKFLPTANKKESEEFYWSLIIEPGWVQAGIWKITNGATDVIYSSQPVAWEVERDLINASDTVLSSAIQSFPEDSPEPSKTVFGVSYSWIKDGEIAPEHLENIKKICTDLSLIPVGFVVMAEAVTHLIRSETGTPINAIVLGIYKQNLELSLFIKGKLSGTTQIARSVSLSDDVVEGLTRLTNEEEPLPSRILVYDGREGDLEDARQELLQVDWEMYSNLKFLHSPKVEVIESERKIFAVSLAGASELAGVTSLVSKVAPGVEQAKEPVLKEMETKRDDSVSANDFSAGDMGFVVEKAGETEVNDIQKDTLEEEELTTEEDLGLIESNISQIPENEVSDQKPAKKVFGRWGKLTGVIAGFLALANKMPKIGFKSYDVLKGAKPLVWGGISLLIIIIVAGLFWWFVPKASVTIYLSSRKLEETINLTIDTSISEPDFSSKKVPGRIIDVSVTSEKTVDTTGTKTVGDKATGEVTIYRVGPQITLTSGTFVNGPENLKFAIENSISIASGSASTPGETKVSVTAADIGSQYNLASGTTFTVGNYSTSDMEAKNNSAFAGGSSREIQAVSKEDQTNLQNDLADELMEKARAELMGKINASEFLVVESLESKNISTDFNHKIGDEADSLQLGLTLLVSGIVVSNEDLAKISEEVLKSKVATGFVLNSDQLSYSFDDIIKQAESYTLSANVIANLLPAVNDTEIKNKIKGRQIQIAKDYLETRIPAFTRVEIKIKPSFPGKLKTLPHVERNIELQFAAER